MTATLKDVAELAGVSEKSVSNVVLNRTSKVSPRTLERVRQAIITLNYQPNIAARHLRKTRLGVIALAIPDISNPYFSSIGTAVIETAEALGYTVLIDHTNGQRDKEALVANGLRPSRYFHQFSIKLIFIQLDTWTTYMIGVPTIGGKSPGSVARRVVFQVLSIACLLSCFNAGLPQGQFPPALPEWPVPAGKATSYSV